MNIKAYFFDWMGTLGDATERFTMREKFGREYHHELLLNKFKDANIPENSKEEIQSMLQESTHWLYPESQKLISKLKSKYKLAIISNIYDISAQKIRELFSNFLGSFDVITFSSDIGLKKPDPRIFTYTLNKLNNVLNTTIDSREVVMVGDKQDKDVDPPISLGMNAILINRDNGSTLEDVIIK
jgi:HAD superfamily hydrolase (TIGR01549 family)